MEVKPHSLAGPVCHCRIQTLTHICYSHHHFDYIGDMSTFPNSTQLVVGPDFKKNFPVGYPTGPDSPIRESDWK
jgi:glyoxylase-like metal-dependent hydrolase (beta-lactamase superfamily II)